MYALYYNKSKLEIALKENVPPFEGPCDSDIPQRHNNWYFVSDKKEPLVKMAFDMQER